jgi:tetratricopeptide (TPR) repeat protein
VKVKRLVRRGLEIDDTNSEAYASMGFIKAWFDFDWPGAESAHKRSIELNPGSSFAHYRYAIYLIGVGRVYEAIEKMEHVLELDPLSVYFHSILGITHYFAHQVDKAIVKMKKTLELAPNDPSAVGILAMSHSAKGIYDEGIEMLQQIKDIPLMIAFLGYIYGIAGKKEEAQKILNDFLERSNHGYFSPVLIAAVYAGLGFKDEVFDWLEIAFEDRAFHNWCIKTDPYFDDVRSDPRWSEQMQKRGLAD